MSTTPHVHIQNFPALGSVFEITPARLDEALNRHRDIAARVSVTMGADEQALSDALGSVNVLFGWDFDRAALRTSARNLQLIQTQGAGVNHLLPLDWIPENVTLANCRGAHGERASEYLIMAILALNNGLPTMATHQHQSKWHQIHRSVITGKTLLIVGVGCVGGDTARRAQNFEMRVVGIRRTAQPHVHVDEMHPPEDLHRLLPHADFVIITAPHTTATDCLIGAQELALMKSGAGLVNYSRSKLVDYEALRAELSAGRLSAVLDVFDAEPLASDSPLWSTPNLLVTPHCCSNDPENHAPRSLDILFDNVARLADGRALRNVVDPALQY